MMIRKYLALLQALLLLAPLAPSLSAKTHKGDHFLREGKAAELKGDWDTAVDLYTQAADEDPQDVSYLIAMRRARFEAGQKHVNAGQQLRRDGKVADAMQEFQKAIVIDPSSAIALQELKRTQQMMQHPATAESDKGVTPSELVRKESDEKVASMMGPP